MHELQEFLTPEKCAEHIIVRGLVRVLMVVVVQRVMYYLTKRGFVNHGILSNVPRSLTSPKEFKVRVHLEEIYQIQCNSLKA